MTSEDTRRDLLATVPPVHPSFYGTVEYIFERGKVTTVRLIETLKPEPKPVTR